MTFCICPNEFEFFESLRTIATRHTTSKLIISRFLKRHIFLFKCLCKMPDGLQSTHTQSIAKQKASCIGI